MSFKPIFPTTVRGNSAEWIARLRTFGALIIVAAVAWLLGSVSNDGVNAQATPTRIAVMDVQRVLSTSNPGKASVAKLKQMQDERVARARQMDTEARNMENELNKTTLTVAQRNTIARQLSDRRVAMKRFAEDVEKEMGEARQRELVALDAKLQPVLEKLGRDMALAGIFNKFESGLIYASQSIDITDTVITRFNSAPVTPAKE